jgi:hypothetical protein
MDTVMDHEEMRALAKELAKGFCPVLSDGLENYYLFTRGSSSV